MIKLKLQIQILILVTMGILSSIFIMIFYFLQQQIQKNDIEKTQLLLITLVDSKKNTLIDGIFDERIESLQLEKLEIEKIRGIEKFHIYRTNGTSLIDTNDTFVYFNTVKDKKKTNFFFNKEKNKTLIVFVAKLIVIDEIIGYVQFDYSLYDIKRIQRLLTFSLIILIATIIFSLVLLLNAFLSKFIVKPIELLTKYTKIIAEQPDKNNLQFLTELDKYTFFSKKIKNEIGTLQQTFIKMIEKIENYADSLKKTIGERNNLLSELELKNEKIEKYNEHLEDMVTQRTNELNNKNQELIEDLMIAQKVQLKLIPNAESFPQINNLNFGAHYIAFQRIGGDLYDVIQIDENIYGFIIADVTGHGVPAALISTMLKVSFYTKAKTYKNTALICKEINNEIYSLIGTLEYDLTAFVGIIDLNKNEIQFTNAAHHPAYIYYKDKKDIDRLDTHDTYIGIVEGIEFSYLTKKIKNGDKIIVFTDGLIEAVNENDEPFDDFRLKEHILKYGDINAKEFVNQIINELTIFCGKEKFNDDVAILCIDYITQSN
ncbi:MAG: hypothetical protein A2Z98_10185 [Spirochaetes bacterium GWB1_27_13]|nr:MAG: hypothetical protein A2Z98_10185 [Spirochaetes bacterium GWB1_27_13]